MKLRISPRAKRNLREIYTWYKKQVNDKVAKNITDDITNAINLFRSHPNLGHIEPELNSFPQSFRSYVLAPNYKIIYWTENDLVKIATIFDCRQRPETLTYIINTQTDWLCEPRVEYEKT